MTTVISIVCCPANKYKLKFTVNQEWWDAINPRSQKPEAGGWRVQGYLGLHSEFTTVSATKQNLFQKDQENIQVKNKNKNLCNTTIHKLEGCENVDKSKHVIGRQVKQGKD